MKYFIITWTVVLITCVTTAFTYHAVIASVLPIIYTTMYSSNKFKRYTITAVIISTVITIYGGYFFGICDANMVLLTASPYSNYVDWYKKHLHRVWFENLSNEVLHLEGSNKVKIAKKLALPKKIIKQIPNMQNYDKTQNIRLMRYDFHPDKNEKWVVTEVNSDVPGGFAESSLLPNLARNIINMPELEYVSFGEKMVDAINVLLNKKGTIMMVHCTCFSDDRQVMQYMGDRLQKEGYKVIYGAADHINFKGKEAFCILDN